MSQSSNCTTDNKSKSEVLTVNRDKPSITHLGTVHTKEAKPRQIDIMYDTTNRILSAKASSGSNPSVVFRSITAFLNRGQHEGHQISRVGTVRDFTGTAEIYFCQQDNILCYDNIS